MRKLRRDFLISGAITVSAFALIVLLGPSSKITFVDLLVVNDTGRTVTIQPCWDLDCLHIHGLSASVLRPGGTFHSAGNFPTDIGQQIVFGIRKPGGKPWQFSSCIVTVTAAGQQTGRVLVSNAQPCFTGTTP